MNIASARARAAHARPSGWLKAGLLLSALLSAPVILAAPRVEVFTDHNHPVTRAEAFADAELQVYRLDGLVLAQQRLSRGLPNDEKKAARIAGERLEAQKAELGAQMMEAGEGLVQAFLNYKLERYPAIVFDGEAVIYGITDLAVARRLYAADRRKRKGR